MQSSEEDETENERHEMVPIEMISGPTSTANGQVGLSLSQSKKQESPKLTRHSPESLISEQSSEDLIINTRTNRRRPQLTDIEEEEEDKHSSHDQRASAKSRKEPAEEVKQDQ